MAFEPINIFSRRIDPRGVAELLRRIGDAKVTGPDDDWSEIVLTLRKAGFLRKARVMTFGHSSEHYDGDDWPQQTSGMRGYFSRFPETPHKAAVLRTIGSFRFMLAVPQHDLDIDSDDDRLPILYAVCQHLDGVIFTPSSLRDAHGRILIDASGQHDPQAILPQLLPPSDDDDADVDGSLEEADDDFEPEPPSAERVARRALALTAVAARATLELDAPHLKTPDVHRREILEWVEELGIGEELEPNEWKVLQRPVGTLDQRAFIDSMWRVEGLTVLAWALQRHEMPPDDELIVPVELYPLMGLNDVAVARSILAAPQLRAPEELAAMHTHLLMLHWRLRNYSLKPEAMDFVAFSQDCWFGTFDIETFRIIDNDLAIGNVAIDAADDDAVGTSQSIAMERHLAINWLCGDSAIYSDTDTST